MVAFKDLIKGEEINIKELEEKTLVVDTYNLLYQFLSSIRARDGSLSWCTEYLRCNGNWWIGLLHHHEQH